MQEIIKMSDKYKIQKGDASYFVTFTITDWIRVLADDSFKMVVIDRIARACSACHVVLTKVKAELCS